MVDEPFTLDLDRLRRTKKETSPAAVQRADQAAEAHGFVGREPRRKAGRAASPRTGQVHAKVYPEVSEAIAAEALRRGVTQGVLIEEAWELYRNRSRNS